MSSKQPSLPPLPDDSDDEDPLPITYAVPTNPSAFRQFINVDTIKSELLAVCESATEAFKDARTIDEIYDKFQTERLKFGTRHISQHMSEEKTTDFFKKAIVPIAFRRAKEIETAIGPRYRKVVIKDLWYVDKDFPTIFFLITKFGPLQPREVVSGKCKKGETVIVYGIYVSCFAEYSEPHEPPQQSRK